MSAQKELEDETLMQAYQAGEYAAFEELYRRHSGRVYGFLTKRVRQRHIADDVFQDTWMKLHRYRARYDPRLPFLPWLFTICHNALLDGARKTRASREELIALELDPEVHPESEAGFAELAAQSNLTSHESALLGLRYQAELSYSEIAARCNTSPGNARQMLSRIVRKMRKVLARRE